MPGPLDPSIPLSLDADGSLTPELNKYRAFLYPKTPSWRGAGASFAKLYPRDAQFASPPRCQFGFGFGGLAQPRVIDCVVTDIGIEETMFNRNLGPIRADVAVTLTELSPYDDTPALPGGLG